MPFQVTDDIFERLSKLPIFIEIVSEHVGELVFPAGVEAELSDQRLVDAFMLWSEDIRRQTNNVRAGIIIDHFKRAAFLTYWLRRTQPIIRLPQATHYSEKDAFQKKSRVFLGQYASEATAFSLGLLLCGAFEESKSLVLDRSYFLDVCYVMKSKNVSPHALYLIYKSLFLGR